MLLRSIRLLSFRAHTDSNFDFAPGINLIHGPNGAGKTNILEAIHYLCLAKSFVTSHEQHVLRRGAPHFEVEGVFQTERRPETRIRLVYVPDSGKRVFVNRAPVDTLSRLVGQYPVVVFSPEDHLLTAGGPEERRRFVNNILSQSRPLHLDDLFKYRRALKQRNELLFKMRRSSSTIDPGVLASWDAELVTLAARIIRGRLDFVRVFGAYLDRAFHLLDDIPDVPSMTYLPFEPLDPDIPVVDIADRLAARLARLQRKERELGRTLAGPHLDELVFRLDTFELRRYGSQGQHRTFGMALKLAQYFYLRDLLNEKPLLLLDDVFGSLDPGRIGSFLNLLASDEIGQSFITAADRTPFAAHIAFDGGQNRELSIARALEA